MSGRSRHITFGSIYRRGQVYYFENRKKGIRPTSLGVNNIQEAIDVTHERFGHLRLEDEQKQCERLLQQIQGVEEKAEQSLSQILLKDVEEEYKIVLSRMGSRRSRLHVDANNRCPLSPTTLRSTLTIVGFFRKWLKKKHPSMKHMHDVTPIIADRYFDVLRMKRSAKTYNQHLSALHIVWKRLHIRAGIKENPFSKINGLPKSVIDDEKASKRPFSRDQLETIFRHAEGTRWEPFCRIAYETGLRLGDVASLRLVPQTSISAKKNKKTIFLI